MYLPRGSELNWPFGNAFGGRELSMDPASGGPGNPYAFGSTQVIAICRSYELCQPIREGVESPHR